MSQIKVAVVTGSNKGIGHCIVKRLCKEFDGHVYLTGDYSLKIFRSETSETKLSHCFLKEFFFKF